jgi:hypothetical protein
MMLGMDESGHKRTLDGVERYCPQPMEAYGVGALTRWRHVRDGLECMIHMLPWSEKALAARLQEHWAYACGKVEALEAREPPEWVLPY